jgi:hypothetical protein
MAAVVKYIDLIGHKAVLREGCERIEIDYNGLPVGMKPIECDQFLAMLTQIHFPYVERRHVPQPYMNYMLWYSSTGDGIGIAYNAEGRSFFTHSLCQHDWHVPTRGLSVCPVEALVLMRPLR